MFSSSVTAAVFMSIAPISSATPFQQQASCWINHVVATKNGVRVYFRRKGGPLFVNLADRVFIPAAAPVDPARPEDAAVEVILGDRSTEADKLALRLKNL
jgi:hypothetical protein